GLNRLLDSGCASSGKRTGESSVSRSLGGILGRARRPALAGARMTGGKEENEVGLVIRTRFFDGFLQRITWEHQVLQVVIVAAGMDTRAFRLSWPPHTHLFELDLPSVFESKEHLLLATGAIPACQRSIVSVDLTSDWQESLLQAGFDPKLRTV